MQGRCAYKLSIERSVHPATPESISGQKVWPEGQTAARPHSVIAESLLICISTQTSNAFHSPRSFKSVCLWGSTIRVTSAVNSGLNVNVWFDVFHIGIGQ